MHQRLRPFSHRFSYSVFSMLVDIGRLDEVDRLSPLLSVNRPNVVSFWDSDHSERKGETVRAYADRLLCEAGFKRPAARILLLAYPRLFGYVFNPISVYFVYDEEQALTALIYAVRNTFGERHAYVAPICASELSPAGVRQTRSKLLHVSPFIAMDVRYDFRILPPGKVVRLRIHASEGADPLLAATFSGSALALATWPLTACLLKFPLMTWKIIVGIHWEALKLWLKGAPFRRSPPAPKPASFCNEGTASTPVE